MADGCFRFYPNGKNTVTAQIANGKPLTALRVVFTLAATTQVSIGYLTTQPDGTPGKFCNIRAFDFYAN